jgi:hypothetical protein
MEVRNVNHWAVALMGLCLIGLLQGTLSRADELSDLKAELEAQKARTAELENRIDQLDARQKLKEQSLSEKIEGVATKVEEKKEPAGIPEILEWATKLSWYGDFRYRYEYIDDGRRASDQNRNRIRGRIGLKATINDEWNLGFRIATGTGDPVSTNQTLSDSFSQKSIWLDQGYLDYHPMILPGFNVLAGKIANPFYAVGKNEMIWDNDLNPEGGALMYTFVLSKQTQVSVVGGGFWVDESSSGADPSLWGIQASIKHSFAKPTYILGGASWFDYGNIQGYTDLKSTWDSGSHDFFGNTSTSDVYAYDYDIVELFAEFGTEVFGMPVSVFGDWVENTVAPRRNNGWLVGTTLNKAKAAGSWQLFYDYRDVQTDAVVGQFTSSDFVGGGTGGKGHHFGGIYQLAQNVQMALTYYASQFEQPGVHENYDRLQADVILKF